MGPNLSYQATPMTHNSLLQHEITKGTRKKSNQRMGDNRQKVEQQAKVAGRSFIQSLAFNAKLSKGNKSSHGGQNSEERTSMQQKRLTNTNESENPLNEYENLFQRHNNSSDEWKAVRPTQCDQMAQIEDQCFVESPGRAAVTQIPQVFP